MKPGTVFRWDKFPSPKYGGQKKARWFVCLGDSGVFLDPTIIYICTTTTRIEDFEKGGKRDSHKRYSFKAEMHPFDEDCILDFDEAPYTCDKLLLENNEAIRSKGILSDDILRAIYRGIFRSKFFSRKILMDIHESLNKTGITGLKKPK